MKTQALARLRALRQLETAADQTDTVTMDIPLLIRMIEMGREDIESDEALHKVVTKVIEISKGKTLTMEDYAAIAEANVG